MTPRPLSGLTAQQFSDYCGAVDADALVPGTTADETAIAVGEICVAEVNARRDATITASDDDRCKTCKRLWAYCTCYPRHPGSALPAEHAARRNRAAYVKAYPGYTAKVTVTAAVGRALVQYDFSDSGRGDLYDYPSDNPQATAREYCQHLAGSGYTRTDTP